MSLHLFGFTEEIGTNYRSTLPAYFRINNSTTYDILIMRILTSTVGITVKKTGRTIRLEENLMSFPAHTVTRKSAKPIKTIFNPYSLSDYEKFSRRYYIRNVNFYYNILQEIAFYFYYTNNGNHQSAFVNLYRLVEYISYSFPLMYSSHSGNYEGTFDALKGYFINDKTSELRFFEKFVERLYNSTVYLSLATDFNFTGSDALVSANCYTAFHSLASQWTKTNKATNELSIENKNLIDLLKNTRNRYFHFATGGQRNLRNTDLKDPDFFFQCINKQFINWIAFIYATVFRESVDNALR